MSSVLKLHGCLDLGERAGLRCFSSTIQQNNRCLFKIERERVLFAEMNLPVRGQAETHPSEPEVHLRAYWYVILKRRWVIAAVTLVILGLTLANALLRSPVYTARALLQINRGRLNVVEGSMSPESWFGSQEFYPTQKRVLESFTLAERVVDDLRLWEDPLFGHGDGQDLDAEQREALTGAVLSMLEVTHIRNSQLMEVTFTTPEPELSARLANAIVAQYIALSANTEIQQARETSSFFSDQVEKLHREIQEKEGLLQEYTQREDILLGDQKENMVVQQVRELTQQLSRVRGERTAAEARYRNLRRAEPGSLKAVMNNPSIQKLKNQQASLQDHYEELSAKFAPDWPELRRTQDTLVKVKQRLDEEMKGAGEQAVEAARVEYLSILESERLLQNTVEEQKQEAQRLSQLTADYDRIQVELDNKKAMLEQLLRRQSETGVSAELGEGQVESGRLVERALVPKGPSGFTVRQGFTWGLGLGLILGMGLAFFLEYWDDRIHTMEDLKRVPLPYMGLVPRHDPMQVVGAPGRAELPGPTPFQLEPAGNGSSKDWSITQSSLVPPEGNQRPSGYGGGTSIIAERFKFIRGSLLMSSPGGPPRVILVTGPEKNAGKTFVACNLALSLTKLNKSVLLVDADLRNPQVHRVFHSSNETGLSSVLTGQITSDEAPVVSTPIPNVFLLPAGPPSPTPSELLGSAQMQKTLKRYSRKFDFVLLDSAPLLPVFDSHVLTTCCDVSLLVVRSGQTSHRDVRNSLDLVERVGGKVNGVVLNAVDLNDYAQSYYYSYQSYHYGGDEPEAEPQPHEVTAVAD